jgi:hypothetical protein
MKTGPEAVGTAKNGSGSANMKTEPTPSVPTKMSPGAQNLKTGSDAVGTAENGSESTKHENEIRRRRYRGKLVRELKI